MCDGKSLRLRNRDTMRVYNAQIISSTYGG